MPSILLRMILNYVAVFQNSCEDETGGNRNLLININAHAHNVRIIIAITKRNFHKFNYLQN
jgi:hypothetical protein